MEIAGVLTMAWWLWAMIAAGDDVNANGTRDAGEICITQQVKIVGHENCLTNTLEMGGFDMDKDGMLDFWENLHGNAGLSPTNAADAYLDCDSDGLINLHEYWTGCDPAVPDGSNTVLSIMARAVDDRIRGNETGGQMRLCRERIPTVMHEEPFLADFPTDIRSSHANSSSCCQ